jgi:hypothetical protein
MTHTTGRNLADQYFGSLRLIAATTVDGACSLTVMAGQHRVSELSFTEPDPRLARERYRRTAEAAESFPTLEQIIARVRAGQATVTPVTDNPGATNPTRTARLGRVTRNPGGRYHLITNGQAPCGSGRGTILADTIRDVTPTSGHRVCERCAAQMPGFWTTPGGPLITPARLVNTPATRSARLAELMAARRAANADRPLSGLGRIRADFAA